MDRRVDKHTNVLLVKNLPKTLSNDQIMDLLNYFGASSVRYMGKTGKMKNRAFVTFSSNEEAEKGLKSLHQLDVLGYVLYVEYSGDNYVYEEDIEEAEKGKQAGKRKPVTESSNSPKSSVEFKSRINYVSPNWDIPYCLNESLRYKYPDPNDVILKNIMHCLASVPKFYVQVLHLMNKMNLPPPFTPLTNQPPIPRASDLSEMCLSTDESELESSDDNTGRNSNKSKKQLGKTKRKADEILKMNKRLKSQINQEMVLTQVTPVQSSKTSSITEVFDVDDKQKASRLQPTVNLPEKIDKVPKHENEMEVAAESFGKMEKLPAARPTDDNADQTTEPEHSMPVLDSSQMDDGRVSQKPNKSHPPKISHITARELKEGRLAESEHVNHPVLKKYVPGSPCPKLYIKNIAKQATEKDLLYIFGRYVNWDSSEEIERFHIQYMTEGRMRGQAFVTLPHTDASEAAVSECHSYVLHGKPISVSYAKSS